MKPTTTTKQVACHLGAGQDWAKGVDIPDVLDQADAHSHPGLVAEVINRRRAERRALGRPRTMPYPKPDGIGHRRMTVLDPPALLHARLTVAPAIPRIEDGLSDDVFHTRCWFHSDRVWATLPFRRQLDAQKARRAEIADLWPELDQGHLDIRNHYATITVEHLAGCLSSIGCDDALVVPIIEMVSELAELPGAAQGLPVGVEASAPLGTVALISMDRLLRRSGVPSSRWMDDLGPWARDEREFAGIVDLLSGQAARAGQHLNETKTSFGESAFASGVDGDDDWDSDAFSALWWAITYDEPSLIPRCLGRMTLKQDPRAVSIIARHLDLFAIFPRHVGRYLGSVRDHVDPWESFVEFMLGDTTERTAGLQLHLARAMPPGVLSTDEGSACFDKGTGMLRTQYRPLGDRLLRAAGASAERGKVKRKRGLELADEITDLNTKRAAVVGLRTERPLSKEADLGLRHLSRQDPDFLPTEHFLRSA